MSEITQSDSAAVRWAANLRVVRTVYYAFGGDDTAVPEMIVTLLYAVSYLATVLAIFSATAP
jgi:hypothetical protein